MQKQTPSATQNRNKGLNFTAEISAAAAAVFGRPVKLKGDTKLFSFSAHSKLIQVPQVEEGPLPFFSTWAFVTVNEKCVVDKEFDAAEKHQQPKLFVFNSFYKVSRPDLRPRLLAEGGRSCTVLGLAEAS